METTKFEEINKLSPEIQAAKDKLNALHKRIIRRKDIGSLNKFQAELIAFTEKLQKKFPDDFSTYSAYHILASSGMSSSPEHHLDFEGKDEKGEDYSVIKFIDGLEAKITEAE